MMDMQLNKNGYEIKTQEPGIRVQTLSPGSFYFNIRKLKKLILYFWDNMVHSTMTSQVLQSSKWIVDLTQAAYGIGPSQARTHFTRVTSAAQRFSSTLWPHQNQLKEISLLRRSH